MAQTQVHLTPREVQILRMMAGGYTDKEIAQEYGLSPFTIRTHATNILVRLGVTSRAAAVAAGFRSGLLT